MWGYLERRATQEGQAALGAGSAGAAMEGAAARAPGPPPYCEGEPGAHSQHWPAPPSLHHRRSTGTVV